MFNYLIFGILLYFIVFIISITQQNLDFLINVTGGIGIGALLLSAFIRGVFSDRNRAIVATEEPKKIHVRISLARIMFAVAIPNLLGSLVAYLIKTNLH